MSYSSLETVVHIPSIVGKLMTQAALALAFLLALAVNRNLVVRPNTFLVIVDSDRRGRFHGEHQGRGERHRLGLPRHPACRVRRDALAPHAVVGTQGHVPAPVPAPRPRRRPRIGAAWGSLSHQARRSRSRAGSAAPSGRSPPTQVAHYAAVAAGMIVVLWFAGMVRRNIAILVFCGGVGILVLTHTRTALIALLAGILVAGLSLFGGRKRVRNVFGIVLVVLLLSGVVLLPALTHWFSRGQSTQEITQLTGRTVVWSELVNAPRPVDNIIFGQGLSNDSFNGLPIDNSWLSIYQGQGLLGDVLCGLLMLSLLLIAAFRPRGPARAVALFLLVYCLIASFTETGLGDASTYMLDLTIAASLLVPTAPDLLATQRELVV